MSFEILMKSIKYAKPYPMRRWVLASTIATAAVSALRTSDNDSQTIRDPPYAWFFRRCRSQSGTVVTSRSRGVPEAFRGVLGRSEARYIVYAAGFYTVYGQAVIGLRSGMGYVAVVPEGNGDYSVYGSCSDNACIIIQCMEAVVIMRVSLFSVWKLQ